MLFNPWEVYESARHIEGIALDGDHEVPPTTKWNHLWLLFFVWKQVSVLEVMEGFEHLRPFQVGFKPFDGPMKIRRKGIFKPRFAVRHGHEDCTFFVIGDNGQELPLRLLERIHVRDLHPSTPLI